jgi:hypothetical protein
MHVRVCIARRGTKSYRSVQLVQSYRRPDGMPAHRVIATLGDLPEVQTENLRRAIAASRQRELVVFSGQPLTPTKVARNLAYLDVAVCYRAWQSWRLSELIDGLVPATARDVSVGETAAALAVQRCVAPASDVEASRWYPRTALPELQGLAPASFNNTRVHRTLDLLAQIETPLQQTLTPRIADHQGRFVSLFLDCTDTWFVGHGPELAVHRVTKEGLRRRRIGIVLLCDQRGLPLRWATLPGSHYEARTMMGVIDAVHQLPWARHLPLVADRAMGRGVTVEELLARDVRCVTAVPAPEIAGYSARIPLGIFDQVRLGASERKDPKTVAALRTVALGAGFREVSPTRYVLDLGVIAKGDGGAPVRASAQAPSRARAALLVGRSLEAERAAGTTWEELAQRSQCTRTQLLYWQQLLTLPTELQARIEAGEADRVTPKALWALTRRPAPEQPAAFAAACQAAAATPVLRANRVLARLVGVPLLKVRAVVLFNPERFIEQRQAVTRALAELDEVVAQVNRSLQAARATRSPESAVGKVRTALGRREMLDVFAIKLRQTSRAGRVVPEIHLVRDEEAWQRHRRTDGLNLIVAHPDVAGTGAELAALYFAKDQVEKDFQAIKSVLALRPVHHHTDAKVRAHVSLCMLGLLLERTLEQQLRQAGMPMTAEAALRELHSVHLNLYATKPGLYSVTEVTPEQRRLLAALEALELADDATVTAALKPR